MLEHCWVDVRRSRKTLNREPKSQSPKTFKHPIKA